MNEGHAGFVVLERARSYMAEAGQPFEVALAVTRAGNLFTTHTPVEAGFDRFAPELFEQHSRDYAQAELRIPMRELLAWVAKTASIHPSPSAWPISRCVAVDW